MKRTLVIMVKEPRPGRVKTRLGRDIGMVTAAWWFRHQSRRLIRRMQDPRWTVVLAVSPDNQGLTSRIWPKNVTRLPQGSGDLGQRMTRMMRAAPGPVCVVGADIPGIETHHIWRAFRLLGSNKAVFGPAPDGGYWLVGLKQPRHWPSGFLENVRWSTEHALADSVASLPNGYVAFADELADVDTAADLP